MERYLKAAAGATAPSSRKLMNPSQTYASPCCLTKGLLICAGMVTFASIFLISVSTPPSLFDKGPLPPTNIRTLFTMLHAPYHHVHHHQGILHPHLDVDEGDRLEYESRIKQVFEKASMPNRTVILTTLNEAWAKEGTMINLLLESFWIGYGTQRLLQHLIFICVDEKAYERCLVIHPHCIRIKTHNVTLSEEQALLSTNYIKLVWRRIKFLKTVLSLNFDFIFTDTDVLWFRDPFPFLQGNAKADIQIASDDYNKRPWDIHNKPNTGFMYVHANERTINFFNLWYEERKISSSLATQGIFNIIKFNETFKNIGMKLYFLDPQYFGGFCGIKHADMTKSITMHATCCKGLVAKLIDLKRIFGGWKKWQQLSIFEKTYPKLLKKKDFLRNQTNMPPCDVKRNDISPKFPIPLACIQSFYRKTRFKSSIGGR